MTNEGKRRAPTTPLKRKAKKPRSFIVLLELMELAYEEMDDIELTVHYRDEDRRRISRRHSYMALCSTC